MLLAAPAASPGEETGRTTVLATPRFAFHSDFDTNLNDALIAAGIARTGRQPELFHSGDEVLCFGKLPQSARAAWDRAVDYYAEIVSPSEAQQFLVRLHLAGFGEEVVAPEAVQFLGIAAGFRTAAAPAYKACRWTDQDAKNRRWIEELKPRLAADEERIAARLEKLYQKRWEGPPILVDVVETVNWSGANTIFLDFGGGHILVSTSYQGPAALEVVFHEASHLMMGRGDPLRQALDRAAKAADVRLPGDLWHVIQFYTTGEIVRRVLEDRGESGYKPIVYGIYDRGTWVEYRDLLEDTWRPYLDDKRKLRDVATSLIEALRKLEEPHSSDGQPKEPR